MADKSRMYLEAELAGIEKCTDEEIQGLLPLAYSGDKEAVSRLVEGNMYRVVEAAGYFQTEDIPFMDLLQEGNMALFLFCTSEEYGDEYSSMRMDAAIREAIESFVEEEEDSHRASEELKTTLNVIDEVCVQLTDKLGREPSTEEVAEMMKMDADDVKYLMRIALNAIKKD